MVVATTTSAGRTTQTERRGIRDIVSDLTALSIVVHLASPRFESLRLGRVFLMVTVAHITLVRWQGLALGDPKPPHA